PFFFPPMTPAKEGRPVTDELTPSRHPLDPLVRVMARLRGPGGCPWDREQDHHSLKKYVIEEAYEVVEAIEAGDDQALVEELGDLLLQVVFHSQIASEEGDRKSTRLNSSHVKISYAVFCLKKKNTHNYPCKSP